MKRIAIVVLGVLILSAGIAAAEEIKIGGGGAPIDGIIKPVKDAFEKSSGISLNLVFSSATISFKQLMAGEVEASTAGLAYGDLLVAAKKDGIVPADPALFVPTTIGKGKLYTIVNKSNPVGKLTKEQIKGIFSGKIANWKEVGGSDAPIIVVVSKINPASNAAYRKIAMDNEPFTNEVLDAGRFEDLRQQVAANPEAIGFGPVFILDDSIKNIDSPEVSRPIIMITKGKPAPKVLKLVNFINGDGQKYVKQ
jgi:phosphate transport system substrate-binding protein